VTSPRPAIAIAAGAVGFGLIALFAVWQIGNASGGETARGASGGVVRSVSAARPPFLGLTAGSIRVGGRKRAVVVADDEAERVQGLRGRMDASPYDGMLFVFPSDSSVAFTMAGVPAPLDIAFYSGAGAVVDRLHMKPCKGTDATCPAYRAKDAFRYALETAPGDLPRGALAVR
jgi:uncharacterized membrane protein (UPF0127 family)